MHQLWLGQSPLPDWMEKYQRTAQEHHPDYQYELWGDERLEALVQSEYNWIYEVYTKAELIQKTDLGRYCVLHKHGGVYCDLDVMWFKPISESNFTGEGLWLAPSHPTLPGMGFDVTNYVLASPIGHEFWLDALKEAKRRIQSPSQWWNLFNVYVPYTTGAKMLSSVVQAYNYHVFAPSLIVDLFCEHTPAIESQYTVLRATQASRFRTVAIHNGGPARSFGSKKWSGNATVVRHECRLRKAFRVRGNAYQFPLVSFLLYGFIAYFVIIAAVVAGSVLLSPR